jgi:hypothetical protein
MGHINFEINALIKRKKAIKKMSATCGTFEDKKNEVIIESNLCLLLEVVCVFKVLKFIVA